MESAEDVMERVKARLAASERARMNKAAPSYGSERAKKFFARGLGEVATLNATIQRVCPRHTPSSPDPFLFCPLGAHSRMFYGVGRI